MAEGETRKPPSLEEYKNQTSDQDKEMARLRSLHGQSLKGTDNQKRAAQRALIKRARGMGK